MPLSLLLRRSKTRFDTPVGVIQLDASVEESHRMPSIITNNSIEEGGNLNDHIYNSPNTVSINGIISDTSINLFENVQNTIDNIAGTSTPSVTAFELFEQLRKLRTTFTLFTGLKIYENMAIEDNVIVRNSRTNNSLTFNATCIQLSFAAPLNITITPEQVAVEPDEQPPELLRETIPTKIDLGKQFTTITDPSIQQKVIDARRYFGGATGGGLFE
jgi:hypothetical protein